MSSPQQLTSQRIELNGGMQSEDLVVVKPFVLLKMFFFPVCRKALLLFNSTSEMLNNNKTSMYCFFFKLIF